MENTPQTPQESPSPVTFDPHRERLWATFCHLSALLNFVVWVPFANILGPLVIWLIKRHEMPLVNASGKEALNFQISMTIYTLVTFALCFILIGLLLIFPLILANIIFVIIAAIKTNNGEKFEYPLSIRFIR